MFQLITSARVWARVAMTLGLIASVSAVDVAAQDAEVNVLPREMDSPQMGVLVTDSPGQGVLVQSVALGSPADLAGIAIGDFVMEVDGKPVETPEDLLVQISKRKPGTKIGVTTWRNGQAITRKMVLASQDRFGALEDRAWLGVTLEANGTSGAQIAQVIPGSPAARARLSEGDVIIAVNDTEVGSAKDLVDAIESLASGTRVTLRIAGDSPKKVKIELGRVSEAPPIFSLKVPLPGDDSDFIEPLPSGDGLVPWIERWLPENRESLREQLSHLREQLSELREEIRSLRNRGDDDRDDDEKDDETQNGESEEADDRELDSIPDDVSDRILMSPPIRVVDQRYARRPPYRGVPYGIPYPARPYRYYGHRYGTPYRYGPGVRTYPGFYYRPSPSYRVTYRRYYRPSVRVYVGPFGSPYYYR